ncbi:exported hypothetical protein [Candidatus Sulfopaludibacter sp. SbA4]|nr:exported hypothetical protein [Candidatus Sulfopaludibacter sp. SbA4]
MKTKLANYGRVAVLAIPLGIAINAVSPVPVNAQCVACNGIIGANYCWPATLGFQACISDGTGVGCWNSGGACPIY